MSKAKNSASKKRKLPLSECVEGFLGLVCHPPEKEPKQRYLQRENWAEIRGFNKAQETFRDILKLNGAAAAAKLAETRSKGQQQPQKIGDMNVWMGS